MSVRSGMFRGLAKFFTRLADKAVQAPERLPRILGRVAAAFLIFEFIAGFITFMIDTLRAWRPAPVVAFPITELPPVDVHGNDMKVYTSGAELYQAMLDEIRQARRNVFFETFIWKNDEIGRLFKDALIAAARRGVHVFVIWDAFGNLSVPPAFTDFPRLTHLHVMRFGLFRSFFLSFHSTGRDHRKLLVVDNRVGFIGGYNIGSLYANQWRDTHLRIEGAATLELANAFTDFWNTHLSRRLPSLPKYPGQQWSRHIAAARNEPNRWLFPVRGLYINALGRAQRNVWITQAYFIPDKDILDELTSAANRGVDVKVLIPEISNHIAADWVARSFYSPLLEAGVEIWLYQNAMVHAKTATADGVWTTIGTANIDRLSMTGNYEINLEVYSPDLAAQMEQVFRNDLGNARQLTLAEWEERPWLTRVIEGVLRPLGSVL
nr:phospholipase D-like domain-containing protein [Mobiluncus mulieris]